MRALRWVGNGLLFLGCYLLLWVLETLFGREDRNRWMILALALAACSPFEVRDAVPFDPPASYRVLWDSAQACTGRRGDFDRLTFFIAEAMYSRGQNVVGHHDSGDIYLLVGFERHPMVVKHEMIHALGFGGNHPHIPFHWPCRATWGSYQDDGKDLEW